METEAGIRPPTSSNRVARWNVTWAVLEGSFRGFRKAIPSKFRLRPSDVAILFAFPRKSGRAERFWLSGSFALPTTSPSQLLADLHEREDAQRQQQRRNDFV